MSTTNRRASIFWMISWSFSFSIAMALSKCISDQTSSVMIVFIRSIFGIFFLTPFVFKHGIKSIKISHPFLYLSQIVFSTFAMVCTYYVYSKLPIATATSIGFTGPFISVILAMFFFSEKVGAYKWALILLGYTGVLIIAQPGSLEFHPAIFIALLANFLASCSIIATKILTKSASAEQIAFVNSSGRIFLLGILSFLFWSFPTPEDWIYLTFIGVFGTISQLSYILALKSGQVSMVAPFEYSRLVIAVPIGILIFAEIPTIWTFIGSFIIIASNFGLTYVDQLRKARKLALQP